MQRVTGEKLDGRLVMQYTPYTLCMCTRGNLVIEKVCACMHVSCVTTVAIYHV